MLASMSEKTNPIVLIPARMASTRLPGKPLAHMGGKPMIVHVLDRAREAGIGPVVVATSEDVIKVAIEDAGGEAVMTDPGHLSGSDRINEALSRFDPERRHHVVVNLQGDLPTLAPALIAGVVDCLVKTGADMATLGAPLADEAEWADPNVVKVIADFGVNPGADFGDSSNAIASDFRRTPEAKDRSRAYHHIGIYAYRRDALERFVALAPSQREQAEKLEQLRALEDGMTIAVRRVDTVPIGVDTAEDLEQARKIIDTGSD